MKQDWFNLLRPASWRGVAFEVSGEDSEFGRNVVVHEFPQRDAPYVEDMGRKSRPYKMEAWLCAGPSNNFDVWTQRDALIEAVNKAGEGVLVHPFYGVLSGYIAVFTVKQSSSENGGLINFSIEFVEAGEKDFKSSAEIDTEGDVADAVESSFDALKSEFSTSFELSSNAALIGQASSLVAGLVSVIASVKKYGSIASQIARGNLSSLLSLGGLVGLGGVGGLFGSVRGALAFAESVVNIVRDVLEPNKLMAITMSGRQAAPGTSSAPAGSAPASNAASVRQATQSVFVVEPIPPFNTPMRKQQRINQAAFVNLVQCSAVVRSVEMAADLGATSPRYAADSTLVTSTPALITHEEMMAQRAAVVNNINAQIIQLSEQDAFPKTQAALTVLKTAIVRHMTVNGEGLGLTFTTDCADGNSWNNYMSALPLAYRHYGQLTDDVIVARNNLKNPMFINPRAPIVLLNDA